MITLPSPKDHIRLLKLKPSNPTADRNDDNGHFNADIDGEVVVANISDPPSHQAVSYTWGGGERNSVISFPDSKLLVTETLDCAIWHLRKRDREVTLWIDQVCINQNDSEKNDQVPLMSQIYRKATRVLIWLGPAVHGSDAVLDAWRTLGQQARDQQLESYYTEERYPLLEGILSNANPNDQATKEFQKLLKEAPYVYQHHLASMVAWFQRP